MGCASSMAACRTTRSGSGFFSSSRLSALRYVEHLARDDGTLAPVALVDRRIVALASAAPREAGRVEVAFLIDEDQRVSGLGSLLLEHLAAADERDPLAEASSLARLLRPRSVALAGVRSDGTGVGAAVRM